MLELKSMVLELEENVNKAVVAIEDRLHLKEHFDAIKANIEAVILSMEGKSDEAERPAKVDVAEETAKLAEAAGKPPESGVQIDPGDIDNPYPGPKVEDNVENTATSGGEASEIAGPGGTETAKVEEAAHAEKEGEGPRGSDPVPDEKA